MRHQVSKTLVAYQDCKHTVVCVMHLLHYLQLYLQGFSLISLFPGKLVLTPHAEIELGKLNYFSLHCKTPQRYCIPKTPSGNVVYQSFEANTQHRHLSRNNVECLEKYGWFIWPDYNKHYNPFPWSSTPLMSMEHSLHPNMNSGISVINNTFIRFSSYKQFCKDTHSIVLIYPVKYLVKWVSILNSRNSDDL